MKHQSITLALLLCGLCAAAFGQNRPAATAQTGPWKDISELSLPKRGKADVKLPQKFRLLELDVQALSAKLSTLPADFSRNPDKPTMVIELPLPDGSSERFRIFSDPIMHPDLARQFPEIQTFAGKGIDDPSATLRMDLSPHGFNAQILSDRRGSIYISPVAMGDDKHNISYFKKDSRRKDDWKCYNEEQIGERTRPVADLKEMVGNCGNRREYRLALACTGEYAAFCGGTVALTLAAMNTSMNRVNGVFERDCSIRMNLIANNNLIVFLDTLTDGYTNSDGGAMLGQNQSIIDMVIGSGNYDIGHVFSTGGGGIADFAGPCNNGNKAHGVTGSGSPVGDNFDIDYVAHEMGHQFSAGHTWNSIGVSNCSAGQFSGGTAFEPGSGSTIMSYAGICDSVDIQPHSDDYFHAISLQQIVSYSQTGTGSTCGTLVAVANNQPTVSAGGDFTIPRGTPFKLTASGSDPDGNAIRYCWEQMDNQPINHPPASTATMGPVFRSFNPTASPVRIFPQLPVVLNNSLPSRWEVLPSVGRTLNFRVTVRDYAAGGGCTDEDDMAVTVDGGSGPFVVTGIGIDATCLYAGDNTSITWNVANTTAAPVSCANVDIWLSLDGGQNFTVQLADDTPNDGVELLTIPASAITTQGRIMVMASNNIFFNVNNRDIRIDCPLNRIVTDNPASGDYKVRQSLETQGPVVVLPATSARFFAGEKITLKPGFWARSGSNFIAKIKPCDACVAGRPAEALAAYTPPTVTFYETGSEDRTPAYVSSGLIASAFPNPFDRNFTLSFELPLAGKVDIQLMDFTGRIIRTICRGEFLEAGRHDLQIDAGQLENGLYDCRIVSKEQKAHVKLIKID